MLQQLIDMINKLLYLMLITSLILACKKNNFEEIQLSKIQKDTTSNQPVLSCDTSNITYSSTITSILNNNCNSCHSTAAGQDPILDNYQNVKDYIDPILDAINHKNGVSPMPSGGNKLDACTINKITAWKNKGFPQ